MILGDRKHRWLLTAIALMMASVFARPGFADCFTPQAATNRSQ
jgi:hypothetical protein